MKFILCNRDEGHTGGDMIQLRGYEKALKQLGYEAVYLHPSNWYRPTHYYDEAWLFHCNFDWSYNQYRSIKEGGVPFRMFPIFYKGVYVNTEKGKILQMVEDAKSIHCLSSIERQEMIDEIGIPEHLQVKMSIIPNGVDESIFNISGQVPESYPDGLAVNTYVISTGRFAGEKGFHHIINACKRVNIPVMIIGATWEESYAESLRRIWDGAVILNEMNQEHLSSYLRSAKLYVCAAENERNNLALIEGIACGARPISSPGNRGNEWFSGINIIDPKNTDALSETIEKLYNTDMPRPAYNVPSWKDVMQMILK